MNGSIQECCDHVADKLTDLSAEERDLVQVFCRHGRSPNRVVKLIQNLRWQDVLVALRTLHPPGNDRERQRAKVLHDDRMPLAGILADIEAARNNEPQARGPKQT